MRTPLINLIAIYAQALPFLGVLRDRARLPAARGWVVIWCAILLAADLVALLVARLEGYNLWLVYVYVPLSHAVILWTLSLWQPNALLVLAYRIAIPFSLVLVLALLFTENPVTAANNFGIPALRLLALTAAAATLVTRSAATLEPVARQDWFWITLGVAVYFAVGVALQPFVTLFLAERLDLVDLAYRTKAWTDVGAFLLITRGMLCPLPPTPSGGSS